MPTLALGAGRKVDIQQLVHNEWWMLIIRLEYLGTGHREDVMSRGYDSCANVRP